MKRLTFAAFVGFWVFVATVLSLAALQRPDTTEPATPAADQRRRFSLTEVAAHGDADSCWMAIEGKVYDLTGYLDRHPAPPSVMLVWCGRDATAGMRTKGDGRDHSARAWAELGRFYIGELD